VGSEEKSNHLGYFTNYFDILYQKLLTVTPKDLIKAAQLAIKINQNNRKIICVGNGGSAAMASHVAVDFTKAARMRSVNFNEADLLTCFANDYGYENWVTKALEFYADDGDLVILISSSGQSPNMLNGAKQAKVMGLPLVTLSGFKEDNPLRTMGDVNLWVDSNAYNIVEMTHHIWLLAIIDYLIEQQRENA
jgi:D-sedoheptulose 7-phosphate isomerase